MSETIIETCSCGASITATGSPYRQDWNPNSPRGVEEVVERWRSDHKHAEPEKPLYFERS